LKAEPVEHDIVLARLSGEIGVGGARPGTEGDAVTGVVPSTVVAPASVEEVSRLLAWVNDQGLKVVPCGTRTKLDRGAAPTRCDILLNLSRISGVVEHAAGDMTVTVRAGTPLEELQAVLAQGGQFLAVDPPVPGTVGGLIATGDNGPRRLRYGGVRDLLLGITFVRADGVVAKAGGKVVKNVAGYDLAKLFTGSLGTLGVIVEATFRLYPLPAASATVVSGGTSIAEAGRIAASILGSTLVPTSLDYHTGGEGGEQCLAVRFESSPRSVEAQAARAADLLPEPRTLTGSDETCLWQRFDEITATEEGDVLARLISTVTDLPPLLQSAQEEAERAGIALSLRAHMGHGHALLRWLRPGTDAAVALLDSLRRRAEAGGFNLVIWRAPAEVRARLDVWGEVGEGLPLMRRIKAQFDPQGTLNPGRFVGEI
jgi:glycolate oxidase FAD binding subunit